MRRHHGRKLLTTLLFSGLALTSLSAKAGTPSPAATPYPAAAAVQQVQVAQAINQQAVTPTVRPRLYALDCGRVQFADMGMFSDTGEYDGRPGALVTPCFLIVHPRGTLLWDAGLGDHLAGKGAVPADGGVVIEVRQSLQSQLQRIGANVDYVAFSHFHFDHTGNALAFRDATWLVNRAEFDAALDDPSAYINPEAVQPGGDTKQAFIEGDHDVFGDGTVKILRAPGHTEGHQVLLVRLVNSGPVILSGDLYHTRENRRYQRVPTFNSSRAESLASMNRIETLATNLGARIIVQHDPQEFATLPSAPAYLD